MQLAGRSITTSSSSSSISAPAAAEESVGSVGGQAIRSIIATHAHRLSTTMTSGRREATVLPLPPQFVVVVCFSDRATSGSMQADYWLQSSAPWLQRLDACLGAGDGGSNVEPYCRARRGVWLWCLVGLLVHASMGVYKVAPLSKIHAKLPVWKDISTCALHSLRKIFEAYCKNVHRSTRMHTHTSMHT